MASDVEMDDFIYEKDEEPDDQEVLISNMYIETKAKVTTEPEAALTAFADIVSMSQKAAKRKWCLKALTRTVKIYCRQGKYGKMMEAYRDMLKYDYHCSSTDKIVGFISDFLSQNLDVLQEFCQTTIAALEERKLSHYPCWFRTKMNICNILVDSADYTQISQILKELHKYCQKKDGTYDPNKGNELLEVYANEFKLYTEKKDNKDLKMQQLYQEALTIKCGLCDHIHRVIGLLRECGGKMYMAEHQWEAAAIDFRAALIHYVKAGNQRPIQCLKYHILANMMGSEANPFDHENAKPYENDPEILAMKASIEAYQKKDFVEFKRMLNSNQKTIMDDTFIKTYMEDMLKKTRTQELLNLINQSTDTKISIEVITTKLQLPVNEVMESLRSLILDSGIHVSIDEVNGNLLRGDSASGRSDR